MRNWDKGADTTLYAQWSGNKYYNADGTPAGATWSTPSDVTLVPLFTANVYTVTLDANATIRLRLFLTEGEGE